MTLGISEVSRVHSLRTMKISTKCTKLPSPISDNASHVFPEVSAAGNRMKSTVTFNKITHISGLEQCTQTTQQNTYIEVV